MPGARARRGCILYISGPFLLACAELVQVVSSGLAAAVAVASATSATWSEVVLGPKQAFSSKPFPGLPVTRPGNVNPGLYLPRVDRQLRPIWNLSGIHLGPTWRQVGLTQGQLGPTLGDKLWSDAVF